MQDFRTLKLLDRVKRIFTRFDVDYPTMRKILQVKLLMDRRRVPTIFNQSAKKKGKEHKDENSYMKSLWIYVLMGLFMIPFIIFGDNYFFQMSLVFGILTFLVMTSMISDFSSVLLDIRDRNILHPKPIDRKTLSAAKMIHISIYLFFLTVSIIGIPLIVGLFKHGILFFIVSILSVMLIIMLVLVFTALLYMFMLKFFDGEKLKDLINYVQIGLSLAMMIGYQLLVRSFEIMNINVTVDPEWWQIFIFPMWYGAAIELLMNGQFGGYYLLLTSCGVIVPIISFVIYLRLVPTFEKNLLKLSQHGKGKEKKRSKFGTWMLTKICSTKEERAFFHFSSLMMKNERDFKLKVYPSLGFSFVLPFILLINQFSIYSYSQIAESKQYLNIYFGLLIIPTVMMMLKFSGKYKGAWIFKAAPIKDLYPIFSGAMKAFIIKLFLPVYLFLSVVFIGIFGLRIWPDLLVVFIHSLLYGLICFLLIKKSMPFSESFDGQQKDASKVFLLLIILPVLVGMHFVCTLVPYGVYGYLAMMAVLVKFLWRKVFNVSWDKVES
jgi:ABC-2 type transport system permease protein